MIYDVLDNLEQYTGLFPHLDTALTWLAENDLEALPMGRTDIDGDDVYITVQEPEVRPSEGTPFETHSVYMDIHIDLEGVELYETALGELEELQPYDSARDCALYSASLSSACVLGPGRFVVSMAEEPHKSCVESAEGRHLKKCVVKVRR